MKPENNAINDSKIFLIFAISAVFLMWAFFLLAVFGIFTKTAILLSFAFFFAILIYLTKKNPERFSRELTIVLAFFLLITVFFCFFVTPTVFSGRDYGSISEAAIRLTQFHKLNLDLPEAKIFFEHYGPGKALNFPGFYYTETGNLTTQFPLPYTAWLGAFYGVLGINGFIVANAVLFFLFVSSFFLILRYFTTFTVSLGGTLLAITSFPIFWFFKFTLTENMALALVWVGLLSLLIFSKNLNARNYFFTFSIFGLLAFTRIEGIAIFIFFLAYLLFKQEKRNFIFSNVKKYLFLPLLAFLAIFFIVFFENMPFFKETAKGLLNYSATEKINLKSLVVENNIYLLRVFYLYNLVQYLVLGLAGIIVFFKRKSYQELFVFIILAPVFLYLINSKISPDHPWMLRRFMFAVVPALVLYTCLLMHTLLWNTRKKTTIFIFAILFILNLMIFQKYVFFSDNKNLLAQTEDISRNFTDNDLVLVDRLASGDGWSMLSGPLNFLYGKKAVYFFNPEDLFRVSTDEFNNVYLVIPEQNEELYRRIFGSRLIAVSDYEIITRQLGSSESTQKLPVIKNLSVKGNIFKLTK